MFSTHRYPCKYIAQIERAGLINGLAFRGDKEPVQLLEVVATQGNSQERFIAIIGTERADKAMTELLIAAGLDSTEANICRAFLQNGLAGIRLQIEHRNSPTPTLTCGSFSKAPIK